MRKTNRFIYSIPSIFSVILLTACSSEPAKPVAPQPQKILSGEQIMRESQGMAQIGSRWQEGKEKIDKGQALQRQGQSQIDEGQRLVEEGQKIMRESEEGYKTLKQ